MLARNGEGLALASTSNKARRVVGNGKSKTLRPQTSSAQADPSWSLNSNSTIRAQLRGDDTCTALGITVYCQSPVLAMCGELVGRGLDPGLALHAYRSDTLCLTVRAIGEAARLEVNGHGSGFIGARERGPASPIRLNGRGVA
jgi:hypothetical protein